ncbi:MAG: hypothetical protein ACRC14_13490 [Paracoccaceae bacterium]
MSEITSLMAAMSQQNSLQSTQHIMLQRNEAEKTDRLKILTSEMQADRARKNVFRKQMDAILADAMNTLKKTSDQIKQSAGS